MATRGALAAWCIKRAILDDGGDRLPQGPRCLRDPTAAYPPRVDVSRRRGLPRRSGYPVRRRGGVVIGLRAAVVPIALAASAQGPKPGSRPPPRAEGRFADQRLRWGFLILAPSTQTRAVRRRPRHFDDEHDFEPTLAMTLHASPFWQRPHVQHRLENRSRAS